MTSDRLTAYLVQFPRNTEVKLENDETGKLEDFTLNSVQLDGKTELTIILSPKS